MRSVHDFQPSHTPIRLSKYDSEYDRARTAILHGLIADGHGRDAIDIGCGPGYLTRALTAKGWRTTAIDTDRTNIESAAASASETYLGDAISVLSTLRENHYDLVLALELIEHMPKAHGEDLLRNISRVLKPDGALLISTPNRFSPEGLEGFYWGERLRGWGRWHAWDTTHVHIYSSWEILRLLKRSGFALDTITGFHYKGRLPVIGNWTLPFSRSAVFPFNRLGFNIIVRCHKR